MIGGCVGRALPGQHELKLDPAFVGRRGEAVQRAEVVAVAAGDGGLLGLDAGDLVPVDDRADVRRADRLGDVERLRALPDAFVEEDPVVLESEFQRARGGSRGGNARDCDHRGHQDAPPRGGAEDGESQQHGMRR